MNKPKNISAQLGNKVGLQRRKINRPRPAAMDVTVDGQECALIPLTNGQWTLIDADLFEELHQWNWFDHAGYAARKMWICGKIRTVLMHRVILNPPDTMHTDHINGYRCDNRRVNLRIATSAENIRNRKALSCNTLGLKWVTLSKRHNKFRACIEYNYRRFHIGYYHTAELAHAAAAAMSATLHGEFARNA